VQDFFAAIGGVDHFVITGRLVRTGTFKDALLADGELTFRSKFSGSYL